MATTDCKPDVLANFECILADRAGDGPSGKNYDPELLSVGSELIEEVKRLREALLRIAAIQNQEFGSDWDEIEEARKIANEALPAALW